MCVLLMFVVWVVVNVLFMFGENFVVVFCCVLIDESLLLVFCEFVLILLLEIYLVD